MAKNQKKYTPEFKQQLVELYNTGNYSYPQLSSEYGIAKSTILGWVKELTPVKVSSTETISMKEYKALIFRTCIAASILQSISIRLRSVHSVMRVMGWCIN